MTKLELVLLVGVFSIATFAGTACSHGVRLEPVEEGYGFRALYERGGPVVSAEVRVWAPGADREPFQTGWTDARGGFVFHPYTSGTWRIEMDDGMGHAAQRAFEIKPNGLAAVYHANGPSRVQGVITGVSVIFGLFGLYALWRSRSARRGSA